MTTAVAAPASAATTSISNPTKGARATYDRSTGYLTIQDTASDGRRATVRYRNKGQVGYWYPDAKRGFGTSERVEVGPGWWFEMRVGLTGDYKCSGWTMVYG
ncbi:hypothetical protein OG948_33065 [Embleya sp. NBC_00888]|uniref:hypothetical protein n=1 Tax=Embleya sp. NBC_00888 TaxID=2975960 RepID=UPI00386A8A38|nr:hypothetical protein OG948_33065 [Embleya sp. NBC_00888]